MCLPLVRSSISVIAPACRWAGRDSGPAAKAPIIFWTLRAYLTRRIHVALNTTRHGLASVSARVDSDADEKTERTRSSDRGNAEAERKMSFWLLLKLSKSLISMRRFISLVGVMFSICFLVFSRLFCHQLSNVICENENFFGLLASQFFKLTHNRLNEWVKDVLSRFIYLKSSVSHSFLVFFTSQPALWRSLINYPIRLFATVRKLESISKVNYA